MKHLMLVILFPVMAHAVDRDIQGGDIMQVGIAKAADVDTATFLAQQAAIKLIITECGIAHREIKIYSTDVQISDNQYAAISKAGLSWEDCQEGKRSKGPVRERLTSAEITKNQKLYEKHLEKQLGLNKKPEKKSKQLDEIAKKLDDLNEQLVNRPEPKAATVREPAAAAPVAAKPAVAKPVEDPKKAACWRKYNSLMMRAQQEANDNYPPGNMNEGEALEHFNEAQEVKAGCN